MKTCLRHVWNTWKYEFIMLHPGPSSAYLLNDIHTSKFTPLWPVVQSVPIAYRVVSVPGKDSNQTTKTLTFSVSKKWPCLEVLWYFLFYFSFYAVGPATVVDCIMMLNGSSQGYNYSVVRMYKNSQQFSYYCMVSQWQKFIPLFLTFLVPTLALAKVG